MSGFVDSESVADEASFSVRAQRPNYAAAPAALPKPTSKSCTVPSLLIFPDIGAESMAAADVWKLAANDFDEAQELEDEDALLDESEMKSNTTQKVVKEDCSKKKRACKNCSCGLKEMQEAEVNGEVVNSKLLSFFRNYIN